MVIDFSSQMIKIFLYHLKNAYLQILYFIIIICVKKLFMSYMPNQIIHLENRNAFIFKIY